MFIDGISEEELYTLEDVLGRDAFYYLNSTLRIIGWETPVSIIYLDGQSIRIRYNKKLWDFSGDYTDPEYGKGDSIFDRALEEAYNSERPVRELKYALKKYKEADIEFEALKLFPDELEEKLQSGEYVEVEGASVFENVFGMPHNCYALWTPVDVDAIIIKEGSDSGSDADIVFAHDVLKRLVGHVGYDGNFYVQNYCLLSDNTESQFDVYSIRSGLKKTDTGHRLRCDNGFGTLFLKSYFVLSDGTCYDYEGELCERETVHHKNVDLINKLIYKLAKLSREIDRSRPYLEIKVTDMIYAVDISIVENIIIPSLRSLNALNKKAYNDFIKIKELIVYAGLSKDFGDAIQNIMELNRSRSFGGSGRGLASGRLIENLNTLKKRTTKRELALLLNNSSELKARIQKIDQAK